MRKSLFTPAVLVAALALAGPAQGETIEVTRTSDPVPGKCKPNDCSLREAVLRANARAGADTVVLPSAKRAYALARPGKDEDGGFTGDLDVVSGPLTITHPGAGRATIDANDIDRVLDAEVGAFVTLTKIRLTGGNTDGLGVGNSSGGGIRTEDSLTLRRSAVVSNEALSEGGGIFALGTGTTLRVIDSSVSLNSAGSVAGGIGVDAASVVIRRTAVLGNDTGQDGGGLFMGVTNQARISDSTFSANGGYSNGSQGGAMYLTGGNVAIVNTTIAGNLAYTLGGGIYATNTSVRMNAVTMVRNVADTAAQAIGYAGGGFYRSAENPLFQVRNSLIALNLSSTFPNDCAGIGGDSAGFNLLSTSEGCNGFSDPGDIVRPNPKIGKLSRNGGPTKTVPLRKGSPAIGNAQRTTAPPRDQRGRERDRRPDIGAFERGA